MDFGKAIDPKRSDIAMYDPGPPPDLTWDRVDIIDVWKCLKCGHSDYIEGIGSGL